MRGENRGRAQEPRTSAPRCSRRSPRHSPPTSASEVASLGVQVHGGMGYIEETGAAQHYRDARIAAIYEGTNGIQAIDLVTRKVARWKAARPSISISRTATHREVGSVEQCARHSAKLELASAKPSTALSAQPGGCSRRKLRRRTCRRDTLFASVRQCGRRLHAGRRGARIASRRRRRRRRSVLARFFAENIAVQASGLERSVTEGAGSITDAQAALAE